MAARASLTALLPVAESVECLPLVWFVGRLDLLAMAAIHPSASEATRADARDFLAFQAERDHRSSIICPGRPLMPRVASRHPIPPRVA